VFFLSALEVKGHLEDSSQLFEELFMSASIVFLSYSSRKILLLGSLLSSLLLLNMGPTLAAAIPTSDKMQSEVLLAQVWRNQSPSGCTASGCQLNIDRSLLQRGDRVTVRYAGEERQVLRKGDRRQLRFALVTPVRNRAGQVVVPQNNVVEGEMVPVAGGGQFVAERLLLNGRAYRFAAESPLLHDVKDPKQTSVGAIATDAAIGAAGAIGIGKVLGQRRISTGQILGGAAAGAAVGNITAPRAVVINEGQEITLRLTEDFRL
jgi:hypothetical protein